MDAAALERQCIGQCTRINNMTSDSGADLAHALQEVYLSLAMDDLGSILEACDSAVPFLVGLLQDWADKGMHVWVAQLLLGPE